MVIRPTLRTLIDGLLSSSRIENDASVLFITCKGFNSASQATINGKPYKSLGGKNLDQIQKWKSIKGVSNWVNISFTDLKYPLNADHFAFSFKTKNSNDLLNFSFS